MFVQGGESAKENPAYGADVLRLWVASVDYNSDVLIGGRILSQVTFNTSGGLPAQSPTSVSNTGENAASSSIASYL